MLHAATSQRRRSKDRQSVRRQSWSKTACNQYSLAVVQLYVFFLSARNLHVPAAFCLALASSVGLFMLSMTFGTPYITALILPLLAGVCLEIAWFCFFPTGSSCVCIVRKNNIFCQQGGAKVSWEFFEDAQTIRKNSDIAMIFPPVYVAHTGYFDKAGFQIYGLYGVYAGSKILNG